MTDVPVVEWQHGATTTCRKCKRKLTHYTDAATPYWLHPNGFPYCVDPATGEAGPCDPED